jgi:integrase
LRTFSSGSELVGNSSGPTTRTPHQHTLRAPTPGSRRGAPGVHLRDGWLTFTQVKNGRRNPVKLSIPIVPQLQAIIDASPSGDLTFIVNEFGRPFSDAGFGNRFRKWCDEAGLRNCSAHGLRKASASRLAELGCSPHVIQAITGHRTLKEVERYTRAADQKRLAGRAMERMARG